MFIGKCSENGLLGFGKSGRVGDVKEGRRGISKSAFVDMHLLLIQQEEEHVTECAKEVDIPKDQRLTLASDNEIYL